MSEFLADRAQPYDVIFFPEGELRPDTLQIERLRQYERLILPDCRYLTPYQADLLLEYLYRGGMLVVLGELGLNLPAEQRDRLVADPNLVRVGGVADLILDMLPDGPQVEWLEEQNLALHIQRSAHGAAIHLIRYDYEPALDAVLILAELRLKVRLPQEFTNMTVYSPGQECEGMLVASGNLHEIALKQVPLYCILILS